MATIDTSDLELEETTIVELDDKNGNDLIDPKTGERRSITVWGPGSRKYVAAQSKHNARVMKRIRTRGGRTDTNPDEDIAAKASLLAEITISFNNFGIAEEDQVEKTFREFYSNIKVGYITDKVNSSAGDAANF